MMNSHVLFIYVCTVCKNIFVVGDQSADVLMVCLYMYASVHVLTCTYQETLLHLVPPPPPPPPWQHKRFLQISSHGAAAEENRRHTLLLAVLTYYLIFGTMAIIQQSLELGRSHSLQAAVTEVFRCEALGVTSNCTVDYQQYSYPKLSSVVYVMMGLIPAVHMIFVLPARQLWRRLWLYCTRERGGDDKEKGGDDMGALIQRQLSGSKSSSDPVGL